MNTLNNNILHYKNEQVIARYRKEFPYTSIPPEETFSELMKYFWLCLKHDADTTHAPTDERLHFNCVIHAEMQDIDNMWHTFLLFTEEYQKFCDDYCHGQFMHHHPLTQQPDISRELYEAQLNRYLNYIHDHLGEETLIRWFGV